MTRNQVAYQSNVETARSNEAKERETERSNRAQEFEKSRSNRAVEGIRQAELEEEKRHNAETEKQAKKAMWVNAASNVVGSALGGGARIASSQIKAASDFRSAAIRKGY